MRKLLLFIEDEISLLGAYAKLFEGSKDCKVMTTIDGQEGITLIDKEQPDVLIMGIIMPRVDGFGILEHIKARGYTFPVIVISNLSSSESKKRALDLGATEYHCKSDVTLKEAKSIIEKYLK